MTSKSGEWVFVEIFQQNNEDGELISNCRWFAGYSRWMYCKEVCVFIVMKALPVFLHYFHWYSILFGKRRRENLISDLWVIIYNAGE